MKTIISVIVGMLMFVSIVSAQQFTFRPGYNQPPTGTVVVPVPNSNTYTVMPYTIYPQYQPSITYRFDNRGNMSTSIDNGLWNMVPLCQDSCHL